MKIDEIRRLKERSKKFKDAAEFHFSRRDYDLAAFNLEQSLQLLLKARLLESGVEFPKIHGLRRLFLMLGESVDKLEKFKKFEAKYSLEFASLEDAYITARYFPREFKKEEVERLRKFVKEVERFVEEHN
jgi:HEPN domain-containing protein